MNKEIAKERVRGYLHSLGYIIVDCDVMPFLSGITRVPYIAYDKRADAMIGVYIRERSNSRSNDLAEWKHKDKAYFRRATKRWCEKNDWHGKYGVDAIFVNETGVLEHIEGELNERRKK